MISAFVIIDAPRQLWPLRVFSNHGVCVTGVIDGTFGALVAVNKLDNGHWRIVTIAETRFHDADIAARTIRLARTEDVKKLLAHLFVADARNRKPA